MRFKRPGFRAHKVLVILVLVGACKKGAPSPSAPAAHAELPPREVRRDSALLFTYVEASGMFATTDKADTVPEVARRVVRVMGQVTGETQRRNNANVEVIDLRELLAEGKTQPRVMLREAFETGALAQLPPGDSCPLAGPHGPPLPEEAEKSGSPDEPPIAILYGTRWCKACKAARKYLVSNRIPFTAKDIEKDPSAARELREKAARFGVAADRVPVLDVRGRLLVGYDETRLDGFLADW
jgi:glutaredoxin